MVAAFQDRENLYLVMDVLSGGDLRYHISKNKRFSEEETRKLKSTRRILYCLHYHRLRVLARLGDHSQRLETREPRIR